jgi:CheY-like chemotaxis protein
MTTQGKKILYYEDQPEMVAIIQLMLKKKLGLEVMNATTPTEVREALAANCFDLILLDIRIFCEETIENPERDWRREGLFFLEELRCGKIPGTTPIDIPVLVLTAVANTADVDKILEVGSREKARLAYLSKPAHLESVEKAVMELLSE